jgi:hypothetical protein
MSSPWGEYSPERVDRVLQTRVLGWELWALAHIAALVDKPTQEPFVGTALLESSLVHVRCLAEFFVGRVDRKGRRKWGRETDVTPAAFLEGWVPEPAEAIAVLDDAIPRLDKHLSHMTSAREALFGPQWNLHELEDAVFSVARHFSAQLEQADPERHRELAPWLNTAMSARRPERPHSITTSTTSLSVQTMKAPSPQHRAPIDVLQIVPAGMNEGVWAAWIDRHMRDRQLDWPTPTTRVGLVAGPAPSPPSDSDGTFLT